MRIFLAILGLLTFAWNSPATGFSITQHILNYAASSGTISQTVTCTAGRGYIITLRGTASCPSPSLSTTIDTPVLALNYHATAGSQSVLVYYVLSSAGGVNTITATLNSGGTIGDLSISFIECVGLNAFDGIQAGTVSGSATTSSTNVTTGTDVLFSFWLNESGGADHINYYNALGAGSVNVSGTQITTDNGQSSADYFWSGNSAGLTSGTYTNFLTANVSTYNTIVTAAFSITPGPGPTLYVSQYGAGLTNGVDAADAWPESMINDPAFWPGQGSTIHLVGTFTNQLTIQGSGSATYPVTFLFEPGANFTSGAWPASGSATSASGGAINPNGSRFIVIDGKGTGLIQNTNNGTWLGTYAASTIYVPLSAGILGTCSNWVVQNLIMTNIYNRQSYTDYVGTASCVGLFGEQITVSNCVLSDAQSILTMQPVNGQTGLQQNYLVISNKLLNGSHLLSLDNARGTICTNIVVIGNLFDHVDKWDGRIWASQFNGGDGGPRYHLDYVFLQDDNVLPYYQVADGRFDRIIAIGNTFGSNFYGNFTSQSLPGFTYDPNLNEWTNNINGTGDAIQHACTSVWVEDEDSTADEVRNVYFLNNLWLYPSTGNWGNQAGIAGSNVWVCNNTCHNIGNSTTTGGGQPFSVNGQNVHAYNNISFYGIGIQVGSLTGTQLNPQLTVSTLTAPGGCTVVNSDMTNTLNNLQTVVSDFNDFPNANNNAFSLFMGTLIAAGSALSSGFNDLVGWQTGNQNSCNVSPLWNTTGADPHSTTNLITWSSSSDLIPALTDTAAQGTGTNLYAVFSAANIPQALTDFNGVPRPSTGNWDLGAFVVNQSSGGGGGGSSGGSGGGGGSGSGFGGFLRIHR